MSYGPKTSRPSNQNTGFFKLQYHRNTLRFEVEFLDAARLP